ncbi:MAG: hypothetical protein PHQ12_01885 [Chthoniobacteraceae bacterium]|nr:hypothetical protein [Chthoniobacteraceae bacterium]
MFLLFVYLDYLPDDLRFFVCACLLFAITGTYLAATVGVAFLPEWKNGKRFVPIASILLPMAAWALSQVHYLWAHEWFQSAAMFSALAAFLCLAWTFALAWNGDHPAERALRISSGVLFGAILCSFSVPAVT